MQNCVSNMCFKACWGVSVSDTCSTLTLHPKWEVVMLPRGALWVFLTKDFNAYNQVVGRFISLYFYLQLRILIVKSPMDSCLKIGNNSNKWKSNLIGEEVTTDVWMQYLMLRYHIRWCTPIPYQMMWSSI